MKESAKQGRNPLAKAGNPEAAFPSSCMPDFAGCITEGALKRKEIPR